MLKRASTVCGLSARALKRNAFSGERGLSWGDAPIANAIAKRPNKGRHTRSTRARGFCGNPLEVSRQSIGDGDSNDFGKFVGVARQYGRLHLWIQLGAGLDGQRSFVGRFDLTAPVIE